MENGKNLISDPAMGTLPTIDDEKHFEIHGRVCP